MTRLDGDDVLLLFFQGVRMAGEVDWAGARFLALSHHDGRMVRAPGLYGFARRGPAAERVLLFVDHADCIGEAAVPAHRHWADALRLGMNELHVCLKPRERLDRLQLRHHLVKRIGPILNLLDAEGAREAAGVVSTSGFRARA